MPKLLRIFLPLILAALVVTAVTSAAPPTLSQNIGGWAKPHMTGDADGLNSHGFIPAQRSANMIWVNDIVGGPNWITPIFGGGGGEASDYAFTKIDGVNYAIEGEYNNFRLIDLTDQSVSCYDSNTVETTCGPVVANKTCGGSQGDVAVHGTLLIRAHEGTHSIPFGDLTRACDFAGNEVQRVDLTNFDVDGNSFTLTQNGQTTVPIVRGANNTTAGISNALAGGNEQQQVVLTGNDRDGDSFTLTYNGNTTAPLIRGTNYTNNAAGQANVQRALQGATEVQTVALTSFDTNGDSYTLTYNGNTTPTAIVRGQNNTAAGIQNAIMGGNEQQQITLTSFNAATQSFRIQIGAFKSALIGSGGLALNNANLADAINAIPGFAGTVTAANAANTGFTLTFSGASANTDVAAVGIVECTAPCVAANRENAKGAAAMPGWPVGGTVAVGNAEAEYIGYTLTFGGTHQGTDVAPFTITDGTGGVTGTVTETTAGSLGILPAGAAAALGTPTDTGFTVTFSGSLANANALPLTVTNATDTGGPAVISGSVRESAIGGTGITGWTTGGTATVAALTDTGFTVTFAGTLAAINVGALTVTNGTGSPAVAGTVQERIPGAPGVTFRGISLIDISDPHHPVQIGAVPMCGNTHTITKYFDDISNTLYILGTSGGSTTQPHWGLTTCPAFSSPFGSGFEEVVAIPVDHPENAAVQRNLRIPVGGNGNCHDVDVFEELHFMATACSGTGGAQIVDMTNISTGGTLPTLPGIGFSWPGLQTVHSQTISWSGRYTYVNGEPGGGGGGECSFQDDTNKPLVHIIDRATGKLVGQWALPRPQLENANENCTTHTVNMIPSLDRNLMAWSGYTGGVSVIDFTNPEAPREIAYVDQFTLAGASGLGCWTGYWYNDNLYCNELQWGQHVFTVDEPWWKQAMDMDELNPQTFTKLIRCQVSFTGGPSKAGKTGTVNATVKVFGPAPLQAAWGATVEIKAPGYFKSFKTGEAGTVSASVKATKKGSLTVTVPALENMVGCSAPSKTISAKKAAKK